MSRQLLIQVVINAALVILGTSFIYGREIADGVVSHHDTTMCFTAFVLFDMFNALSCRSAERSIASIGKPWQPLPL